MSGGCAKTCRELVETSGRASTGAGVTGGAPAAWRAAAASPTVVLAAMGSRRQSLRALAAA
jgi:hypothetical protein